MDVVLCNVLTSHSEHIELIVCIDRLLIHHHPDQEKGITQDE